MFEYIRCLTNKHSFDNIKQNISKTNLKITKSFKPLKYIDFISKIWSWLSCWNQLVSQQTIEINSFKFKQLKSIDFIWIQAFENKGVFFASADCQQSPASNHQPAVTSRHLRRGDPQEEYRQQDSKPRFQFSTKTKQRQHTTTTQRNDISQPSWRSNFKHCFLTNFRLRCQSCDKSLNRHGAQISDLEFRPTSGVNPATWQAVAKPWLPCQWVWGIPQLVGPVTSGASLCWHTDDWWNTNVWAISPSWWHHHVLQTHMSCGNDH